MSDTSDRTGAERARSLRDAIRTVRTAEAERSDVVVELRDAERARLELLADALRSVFDEVPAEDEQFVFVVAAGTPPRLWIDMTAFVAMARDRRVYRFLKDTRLGRTVILETANLDEMADTVTTYVAERVLERERALEGDWVLKRVARGEAVRRKDAQPANAPAIVEIAPAAGAAERRMNTGWLVAAFLAGILIGVVGLLAYAWIRVPAV